jgi:hypothetical protein
MRILLLKILAMLHFVRLKVLFNEAESRFRTVESFIQTSLDVYAFIAITPSLPTLDNLIQMVKTNNDYRQSRMDDGGYLYARELDVSDPCHAYSRVWITDFNGQVHRTVLH